RFKCIVRSMNGDELDVLLCGLFDSSSNGLRNVENLGVQHYRLIHAHQVVYQVDPPTSHEQFQADFIETNAIPKRFYQPHRVLIARDIEREDQSLLHGNVLGGEEIGLGHYVATPASGSRNGHDTLPTSCPDAQEGRWRGKTKIIPT